MSEVITAATCMTLAGVGVCLCFGAGLLRHSEEKSSGVCMTLGSAIVMLAVVAARFL